MRHLNLIITLFCTLIFSAPLAYAQQGNSEIIDVALRNEPPAPLDTKSGQKDSEINQLSLIDNIPVEILFNAETELLAESMLIVSAYAPPPHNVRRSAPIMLGQTRLLLTNMSSPLTVIIAAPSSMTKDLEYARIEATIIDTNENVIFDLKEPGKYNGYETPILNLTHISEIITEEPTEKTAELRSETVRGKIRLNGKAPKFAGSNLVTRLVEEGLAGGNSSVVVGEMRQLLDGKRAPFVFEFEREFDPAHDEIPLALEVWIEDWAGRKTHVTPAPAPYSGPKTRYRVRLDAIGPQVYNPMPSKVAINRALSKTVAPTKTAKKATTKAKRKPKTKLETKRTGKSQNKTLVAKKVVARHKPVVVVKPTAKKKQITRVKTVTKRKPKPLQPYQKITGKAHFNANKGLPSGSILIAKLERKNNGGRPALLASTRVFLDGLSGAVTFKLKANTVDLDPTLPSAKLSVRVVDKNGKLFFSNPGGTIVRNGFNAVTLTTSPNY